MIIITLVKDEHHAFSKTDQMFEQAFVFYPLLALYYIYMLHPVKQHITIA